jgi:isoleucyl-tRNA synthetase
LPANLAVAFNPKLSYRLSTRGGENFILGVVPNPPEGVDELIPSEPGLRVSRKIPSEILSQLEYQHPFLNRTGRVFPADFVTADTGTGLVHIAPGHGADDYVLGMEHNLPILSPVDDHGRFTDEAGLPNLTGKYVFDANPDIVELLRERGMLLSEEKFHHSYPYCWRSKTPIIFRNVEQFFIRIDDLRDRALDAIHKEVKWIPAWGENRIAGTVESRPDWVISRQRSWGVPLPVFYSKDGKAILDAKIIRKLADLVGERGSNIWFELSDADLARELGLPPGTTKRNDTIDVWIDSGVSHKAVCALHPELRDPADMYLEATDQHRGWFQSSLMTSIALNNRAPYKTCVTHGFVVDLDGKKISKSGTYAKPTAADHFVGRYGADLLRLWASSIDYAADVPFSEEMFTRLGDTYRRMRNTLRILLGNLYDFTPHPSRSFGRGEDKGEGLSAFTLIDRWILGRLDEVARDCRSAYEAFEFHKVYHILNQFCAVDLSSLYIDVTKDRMYCDAPDSPRRRATQTVMHEIFDALCRLLAPVLAFTAEEAWRHSTVAGSSDAGQTESPTPVTTSVHLQEFPQPQDRYDKANAQMAELLRLRGIIAQAIERARQEKLIGNTLEARVVLHSDSDITETVAQEELEEFLIVSDLTIHKAKEASASVTKTPYAKCARCWRHRSTVGASAAHPDLCDRCESVVRSMTKSE